jgi:transketolase N-terminal domain/subunit
MNAHRVRWQAFGWHVIVIDGHDLLIDTYGISARHIAAAVTNRQNV